MTQSRHFDTGPTFNSITAGFRFIVAREIIHLRRDQRLDLCDLYAFQSPTDKNRTVIILNANPNADALHPDAIYRVNIDNDGDYLTDIAFSYVFSKPQNGRQTVDLFMA